MNCCCHITFNFNQLRETQNNFFTAEDTEERQFTVNTIKVNDNMLKSVDYEPPINAQSLNIQSTAKRKTKVVKF